MRRCGSIVSVLAAAVVGCFLAPEARAQVGANCRDVVKEEGGYSISRSYADKVKSWFAWRKAVRDRHGNDFQNWSQAQDRRVDCRQQQIAGVGRRWVCVRTARPCAVAGSSRPDTPLDPIDVYGRRTLERGSAGDFVKNLQRTLQDLNYQVAIDGRFGPATERAVRRFQADRRLVVDGKVGPATKTALLT